MEKVGLIKALYLTHKADKMNAKERLRLQQKRLVKLLSYVKKKSPYFAKLYKDIDIDNAPLSALPVTNKSQMMNNFDSWLTDPGITLDKVKDFMSDINNVGSKIDGKYLCYATSGSTGTPCIVLYDDTTINVSSAIGVLRSFSQKQDLKKFIKSGGRTASLFADNGFYLGCGSVRYTLKKMPWKKKKMLTCDVRKDTQEIVELLNEFQPSMIGCYPSAMDILSHEQETGNLRIHPVIIMTGGEQLTDDIRTRLSKIFDCTVQTNYSCTEGGTVACECKEKHFHINDDWVILEAVDENNNPVPYGTQSKKVLLTNLANKICPIIRFEITDRIVMHDEPCGCENPKPWLTLEGRTDDILCFENNTKISPLALYATIKEVEGVERFQLIQHNDYLELRLTGKNKDQIFGSAKTTIEQFLLAHEVKIPVRLSSSNPEANPISGKFKHIIAKCNND